MGTRRQKLSPPSRTAVIQPLPGIGDMVWHLAHIRAVAMRFGGAVTLVAKPRSAADQIFAAENTIADILWLDRNPERRRGLHDGAAGFFRLVTALRKRRFQRVVILHHSRTLAMACLAAGIPERYGYGSGLQRPFLNRRPFLPRPALRLHPFEQASAWLAAAAIPVASVEPHLPVETEARRTVRERLGSEPFVVLGIGSSEPYKQWGAANFAITAIGLAQAGWPRTVLAGGVTEQEFAAAILARLADRAVGVTAALGWPLTEIAALCAEAAFYVGNDTGVMNLAAAVGARCYGLFGAVEPFAHASQIVPILPPDGRPDKADGMARITPAMVLDQIALDWRRGDLQCRIANCSEIQPVERRATQDDDALPARRT
jgi:heptosyltransferase-2